MTRKKTSVSLEKGDPLDKERFYKFTGHQEHFFQLAEQKEMRPLPRSRRDHAGYPMQMDEEEGLSFGYQLPTDVTAAVKRAFLKEEASGGGAGDGGGLGPFVYHAEGLTFAFIEHQGPEGGEGGFAVEGFMSAGNARYNSSREHRR